MKSSFKKALLVTMLGSINSAFAICTVPPDGMVGWWPGDGNANDIVNGNNGSILGDVSYLNPGKVDQAFSIDSPTSYVQVTNTPVLEPAHITLDAWVNAPTSPGQFKYIVAKGANACIAASYALYTGVDGRLRFYIWDGVNYTLSPSADTEIWDGNWHHVAGTFDGESVRLYVDGAEVGIGTPTGNIAIDYKLSTHTDFVIGKYLNTDQQSTCSQLDFSFVNGDVDEVEVFNRALSQAEIQAIYDAGSDGKCKTITVGIDIKPGSDPNCFNINGHGVIPVAILGDQDLDVSQIDLASPDSPLSFAGQAVRVRGNKGPLCAIEYSNIDTYLDLVCQFEDDPDSWTPGDGEAMLTGTLLDGTPIEGTDSICITP